MAVPRIRAVSAVVLVAALALFAWWWFHPAPATVSVYFVRADGAHSTVQEVPRQVTGRGTEALLAAAIRGLLIGPSESERARGLTSAIPSGTTLRGLRIDGVVVLLDLSREVESGGGSSMMLARFWQLVYTATQFSGTPQVRILIEGTAKPALGGEGVLIDRPVSRPPAVPQF